MTRVAAYACFIRVLESICLTDYDFWLVWTLILDWFWFADVL